MTKRPWRIGAPIRDEHDAKAACETLRYLTRGSRKARLDRRDDQRLVQAALADWRTSQVGG